MLLAERAASVKVYILHDIANITDHTDMDVSDKVLEQMEQVRADGRTNMFNAKGVQRAAHEMNLHALVAHLGEHPSRGYAALLSAFEKHVDNT